MNLILARNFKTAQEIARSRGLLLHEWKYVLTEEHLRGHQGIPLIIESGWETGRLGTDHADRLYHELGRTRCIKEYVST